MRVCLCVKQAPVYARVWESSLLIGVNKRAQRVFSSTNCYISRQDEKREKKKNMFDFFFINLK